MKRRGQGLMLCMCIFSFAAITGCQKPSGQACCDTKGGPPPRPCELDKLDSWVGSWASTGEMKMCDGKTMTMNGTSTVAWECDKRVLVEKMSEKISGDPKADGMNMDMNGMVVTAWCCKEKKLKTTYYNNMGEISCGTMTYCDKSHTWCMKGKGLDAMSGKMAIWEGTMKMPDNNTMEWTWTQWDGSHMKKMMHGSGTAKRTN